MPNTSHNQRRAITAVLVLIAVIAAVYLYTHRTPAVPTAGQHASSTPITTNVDGVSISGGSATVTETPATSVKTPNFRTPLTFNDSVSPDVRTLLTTQFNNTLKALAANNLDFQAWINLGMLRKVTGDYAGAEADWAYTASIYPHTTVPSDNLGELYLDFLRDYPKAEMYFKRSIANDPHDINAYQQLISLYTVYGYKDKSAALSLVEQGITANPDNQTLLQLRSELQAN